MKSIKHYIKAAIGNPRKALWQIDTLLTGGRVRDIHRKRKERKQQEIERYISEHPEEYYNQLVNATLQSGRVFDTRKFAVRDILFSQFEDGESVFFDIAVRILAIEQYYGKNTIGYDLYARMQNNTVQGSFWLPSFEKLIQSVEANGYDKQYPLDLDENLKLIDGAGRLSLALYHNEEFIPVRLHKMHIKREYNYNYLWELNFSPDEIRLVQEKAIELLNKCKYSFVGVIWPSAYHLRKEITDEISTYLKEGKYAPLQNFDCQVVKYMDLNYNEINFRGFMRSMYYADNMTEAVLQWKTQVMIECAPENISGYPVRLLYIDVLNPQMIRNEGNNSTRSLQITNLKKAIRSRYKHRLVRYEYDNVLHVSDNYKQSNFCDIVVNINRDTSELFKQLNKKYDYVAIKLDGRQSADFPKSIYYYTDVDLLVLHKDVKLIGDEVQKWLENQYDNAFNGWVKVKRIANDDDQIMIVVEMRGLSCFMIHIQTVAHFGMNEDFAQECLKNRLLSENKLVYVLPPKYEMFFRAAELVQKSTKVWHHEYISQYVDEYDEKLADMAYCHDVESCIKIKEVFTSVGKDIRK